MNQYFNLKYVHSVKKSGGSITGSGSELSAGQADLVCRITTGSRGGISLRKNPTTTLCEMIPVFSLPREQYMRTISPSCSEMLYLQL